VHQQLIVGKKKQNHSKTTPLEIETISTIHQGSGSEYLVVGNTPNKMKHILEK
jgi:hypothetical protein